MARIPVPKRATKKHHPEIVTGAFEMHYEDLVRRNRYLVIAIVGFAITALAAVLPFAAYRSQASGLNVMLEAERGKGSDGALIIQNDKTASGESFIIFTDPARPPVVLPGLDIKP